MATKRQRITRKIVENLSETALWALGDRKLYPEPEQVNDWELIVAPGFDYPGCNDCKPAWESVKEQILNDWIAEYPGTRPSFWWHYDAPEMRQRLGGIGDACHDVLAYGESYDLGIPNLWLDQDTVDLYNGRRKDIHSQPITADGKWFEGNFKGVAVDPNDPPKFESQAAYLKRLNLFAPGEERRLKPADFEPEVIDCEQQ